jgi:ribonuclease P protein component
MLRYAPARRLRAAVVVSKKVDKSAVVRNRIRRRVYSFVRERIDPNTPHDIIVTIHSSELATIDRAAFDHTLETVFQKAGILTHTSSKNE